MPRKNLPVVLRGAVIQPGGPSITITRKGLELIERLAARGATKGTIAAHLGIHRQRLSEMLNDDAAENNAVLLAWQRGHQRHEAKLVAILEKHALAGYSPAAMFLLKTMHGFRENDPQQAATLAVNINVPQNMSREEWERQQKAGETSVYPTH